MTGTGCASCVTGSVWVDAYRCGCNDPSAVWISGNTTCQCTGATFQDPDSTACLRCGSGTDPNGSGCVCLDRTATLDGNNNCQPPCAAGTYGPPGSCISCPEWSTAPSGSTQGSDCTCTEAGSQPTDLEFDAPDGTPLCLCNFGNGIVYTYNGCAPCGAGATYCDTDYCQNCYCDDPNASYIFGQNICLCQGAMFQAPTSFACLPCGAGTDPNGAGCVCLDHTNVLDANNNCQVSGSQAALSPARKAKRARALLLQSLKTTPWQELADEVLCPVEKNRVPCFSFHDIVRVY